MNRAVRDGVLVATSTLLICLAFAFGWMTISSAYTIMVKHGGACFSYQCTPNLGATLFVLLFTLASITLNVLVMYFNARRIVKVFNS